jgi:hypothetical protein
MFQKFGKNISLGFQSFGFHTFQTHQYPKTIFNFLKLSYLKPINFLIKNFIQKCGKMNVHARFNHKMTNLGTICWTSFPFHTK